MLFAWMGFLKPGDETIPQDVNQQTNDFLQQPFLPIHSVGPLCDENGRRTAMLMIFEANDRAAAEAVLQALLASPGSNEIVLDTPAVNRDAIALAESLKLKPTFETARMYTGPIASLRLDRVFGVTSFELG